MQNNKLLEIKNLRTYFYVRGFVAKAVDNVSLTIKSGETLGLELVNILAVHQLRGKIDLDRSNGTKFLIQFNAST